MEEQTEQFGICLRPDELVRRSVVNQVVPGTLACRTTTMVSLRRVSPSLDAIEREEAARQAREAADQKRMLERMNREVTTD